MDPWPFVIGAYAIAALGVGGLCIGSWLAMRRAERLADSLRGERG